jgi:hypothetical protein
MWEPVIGPIGRQDASASRPGGAETVMGPSRNVADRLAVLLLSPRVLRRASEERPMAENNNQNQQNNPQRQNPGQQQQQGGERDRQNPQQGDQNREQADREGGEPGRPGQEQREQR